MGLVTSRPVIKDGRVKGSGEVCTDISALKEAQSALRKNETMLQSILKAVPVGIAFGRERTLQWSNEYYQRMTGYGEDDVSGRTARLLYESEEEFLRVGKELYGSTGKDGIGEAQTRWKRQDGSAIDVRLSVSPLYSDDAAQGVVISALDVTEKKKADEALRASEARYRELADHLPVGIYEADFDGKVNYANNTALEMFGYSADEVEKGVNFPRRHRPRGSRDGNPEHPVDPGRDAAGISGVHDASERREPLSDVDEVTADGSKRPDRRLLGHRHGHQRAQAGPGGPAEERGPAGKHPAGGPHRCGDRP